MNKDNRLRVEATKYAHRITGGEVERIWYSQRNAHHTRSGDKVVRVFGWVSIYPGQSYGYRVVKDPSAKRTHVPTWYKTVARHIQIINAPKIKRTLGMR